MVSPVLRPGNALAAPNLRGAISTQAPAESDRRVQCSVEIRMVVAPADGGEQHQPFAAFRASRSTSPARNEKSVGAAGSVIQRILDGRHRHRNAGPSRDRFPGASNRGPCS